MPRKPTKAYLTPKEVAALLMVSPITVRQWAQKGSLRAETTPGGHRRFPRRYVESFARERGLALQWADNGFVRVLLVVEDGALRGWLGDALDVPGVVLEYAGSGFEAGVSIHKSPPHVVVLDRGMRGVDSVEMCRLLKSDPNTSMADIIVVSDGEAVGGTAQLIEAGARSCLSMPADLTRLLSEVGVEARPDAV